MKTIFLNTVIAQAIELGFDFEQFPADTTIEEITSEMIDFFNENSDRLPRLEDECEVTSHGNGQNVSYNDYVCTGEIVNFSDKWGEAPETKVFHSAFIMLEGGKMCNMNLYYLVGETDYNAPDGFHFNRKLKKHIENEY